MPFIPHTPESLMQRSDSKNPATTCKGITVEGRHCRRDILAARSLAGRQKASVPGVLATVSASQDDHDGAAAFFCWQHKDQAKGLELDKKSGRQFKVIKLDKRSSIDTLAERLGVVALEEPNAKRKHRRRKVREVRMAKKEHLPNSWQGVQGALIAVPKSKDEKISMGLDSRCRQTESPRSNLSLFCCIRTIDDDSLPSRPSQILEQKPKSPRPGQLRDPALQTPLRQSMQDSGRAVNLGVSAEETERWDKVSPENHSKELHPAQRLHRVSPSTKYIIPSLPAQIKYSLETEFAKSLSPKDEGYIYMFWLTDTDDIPDDEAVSSLVDAYVQGDPEQRRNEVIHRYASKREPKSSKHPSVLLKIGRAANVQRRMNQWQRQCGYNLSLVRWYPYNSSTMGTAKGCPPMVMNPPERTPYIQRVERLIHIELSEQRVTRHCQKCGKHHREWFEIEGSRKALKGVDRVIRRWVEWAQNESGQNPGFQSP